MSSFRNKLEKKEMGSDRDSRRRLQSLPVESPQSGGSQEVFPDSLARETYRGMGTCAEETLSSALHRDHQDRLFPTVPSLGEREGEIPGRDHDPPFATLILAMSDLKMSLTSGQETVLIPSTCC